MKNVHAKGIPIILCTGKPYYSINEIINGANLNNPHIVDSGAVIINPIDNVIIAEHVLEKSLAKKILQLCIKENIYVEFYTVNDYFIQEDKKSDITEKHMHILQRSPKMLKDIVTESTQYNITKIFSIALNEDDKQRVDSLFASYKDKVSFSWGVHPVALPLQIGIITAKDNSKKEAAETVIKNLNLSFENVLGIGDSISDWSYMQLCSYVATVFNGSKELKELIKTKGEGNYLIALHVDENGLLEVFSYFICKTSPP